MIPVPATFGDIHVEVVAHFESPPVCPAAQPKSPAFHWRKLLPVQRVRFAPESLVVEAFVAKSEVVVALVMVAILATSEFEFKFVVVAETPVALVKLRLVKVALVLKRSELVAAVNVPLVPTILVLKRLELVLLETLPLVATREVENRFDDVAEVMFARDATNWEETLSVVEVAFVVVPFVKEALVPFKVVTVPRVAKRSVLVLWVVVAFVAERF